MWSLWTSIGYIILTRRLKSVNNRKVFSSSIIKFVGLINLEIFIKNLLNLKVLNTVGLGD